AVVSERLECRRVVLLALRLHAAWTRDWCLDAKRPSRRCNVKDFRDGRGRCRVRERLDDERLLLSCNPKVSNRNSPAKTQRRKGRPLASEVLLCGRNVLNSNEPDTHGILAESS